MSEEKRIIEIAGIKMEVDMRHVKRIDTFKVGSPVKLLKKQYSDEYRSYPGIIVGLTEFKENPAIDILYVDGHDVSFLTVTGSSKNIEMAPMNPNEFVFEKKDIIAQLSKNCDDKYAEYVKAVQKRNAFIYNFGKVLRLDEELAILTGAQLAMESPKAEIEAPSEVS